MAKEENKADAGSKLEAEQDKSVGVAKDEEKKANKGKEYSIFDMFRYSTVVDKVLMLLGIFLALAQGSGIPLALYYFYADIINAMMSYSECFKDVREMMKQINSNNGSLSPRAQKFKESDKFEMVQQYASLRNTDDFSLFDEVAPLCGYYALVGLGMFLCGTISISFWSIAGERQIHRIRNTLFRSMLSKDAGWFDSRRTGALNNMLFDNMRKMQGGMTSKVPITLSWIAVAIVAYIIAFVTDWLITIVLFALVPLLFIIAFVMIRTVRIYSSKQTAAYGTAGSIANEVLGNIRTVLAFNKHGEAKRMGLIKTVASGLSQGLTFLVINAIAGLAFWWGQK